LLVISAAVAAFLGERAHVRQVRLVHSDAWAQQGRVSVMASHRWAVHR
jgi:methylmalonyl-CoA carboxyltransferase large subunit